MLGRRAKNSTIFEKKIPINLSGMMPTRSPRSFYNAKPTSRPFTN